MGTEKIDIWSVGCIYAELLGMLDGIQVSDRGPLFPGTSCFPLSPDHKHRTDYKHHTQGKHDMLNKIFNLIGTPSDAEITLLERDDAKKYMSCFTKRNKTSFKEQFPHVDAVALDMLEKLLLFSPRERITVHKALEHPVVQEIRDAKKEHGADA